MEKTDKQQQASEPQLSKWNTRKSPEDFGFRILPELWGSKYPHVGPTYTLGPSRGHALPQPRPCFSQAVHQISSLARHASHDPRPSSKSYSGPKVRTLSMESLHKPVTRTRSFDPDSHGLIQLASRNVGMSLEIVACTCAVYGFFLGIRGLVGVRTIEQ